MRVLRRVSESSPRHGDLRRRGFTTVELLIALSLVGLIGFWLVSFVGAQQRAYARQALVVAGAQNARAAVELWSAEAANARFDPRGRSDAGLTHAHVDSVGWTSDLNEDGDVDDHGPDGDERVLYFHDAQARTFVRRADGRDGIVVDAVDSLNFRYLDSTGDPTTDLEGVATIEMLLRFSALEGELQATFPAHVRLRN